MKKFLLGAPGTGFLCGNDPPLPNSHASLISKISSFGSALMDIWPISYAASLSCVFEVFKFS